MQEFMMRVIAGIDPVNAEYIARDSDIVHEFDWAYRDMKAGNKREAVWSLRRAKHLISKFREKRLTPRNVKPGDGVTVVLWSDRYAGTVIKVTESMVVVRRDTAILDPNFKPDIIPGGFAGYCINQNEQTYSYRPNPDGEIYKFRWSNKFQSYGRPRHRMLIKGRHEFYDYNF